jgi:hypothetical protein
VKPLLRNSFLWKLALLLAAIILFALSYIFNTIYTDTSSVKVERRLAEGYLRDQQRDFDLLLQDTALIVRLIQDKETQEEFKDVVKKRFGVFLYTVDDYGGLSINFWSTKLIMPPSDTYSQGDFEEYRKLDNGHYFIVKRSARIGIHTVVAYALIPIKSEYFVDTDLLTGEFFFSKSADKRVIIPKVPAETSFPVRSQDGKTLFYLDKKTTGAVPYNSTLTLILRLGGIVFLLLFIHLLAESLARGGKNGPLLRSWE